MYFLDGFEVVVKLVPSYFKDFAYSEARVVEQDDELLVSELTTEHLVLVKRGFAWLFDLCLGEILLLAHAFVTM